MAHRLRLNPPALITAGVVAGLAAVLVLKLMGGQPVDSATAPVHGLGIATSANGSGDITKQITDIKAAGATWVRADLSWNDVQPDGPYAYDWSKYDAFVQAANRHGLQVLFILDLTPEWARSAKCQSSELCSPRQASEYGAFAKAAATHFRGQGVHSWEIWNEPNIAHRYAPAADPAGYVKLLKIAYNNIKAADPQANVVAGSTSPAATGDGNYSPYDFMAALYRSGAHGYFTAASAHPYTYPRTPDQSSPSDAWGQLTRVHDLMASNNDGAKQIWITEFGAPTGGTDKPDDVVSEAAQADMLSQALVDFYKFSWSGPFLYYDLKDGTDPGTTESYFGLLHADGTPKPAYDIFRSSAGH